MKSSFSRSAGRRRTRRGSSERLDEVYDLRGLNLSDPDQISNPGESPRLLNCRMYAREDGETRVAIRTRKGSRRLSTPIGEAQNISNTAASTGDATFDTQTWQLEPFTPTSSGALTRLDYEIKRTVAGGGHVIVEIYSDSAGAPDTLLAQGAIYASAITTAYQWLPAYFIEAPTLTSGTQYWHRIRVQTGGTATYAVAKTATAGGYTTITPGSVLTAAGYTWHYKSYLATASPVLGFTRRYPTDLANRTLIAVGTHLYSVTDAGVATDLGAVIHASATKVRFDQVDDKTLIVDGHKAAQWYDGTTVSYITNVAGTPYLVIIHENRAFFVSPDNPTLVRYSDLYDFTTYGSASFFYVPSPKSSDWITAWRVFQGSLVIFTHETKHSVYGSDISTFTRKEAVGTKGAVSDEAVAVDRNYIYFMADDKQIYRWNGGDDELLSEKVAPLLNGITDTSKVRFHLYRNQLRVYFPSGADTQAEDMLLLELSTKESNKYLQWFHDSGRAVCGSLEWKQDNNELIEFSSKVGAFYLGETDEGDLGKIIAFRYWTQYKKYVSAMSKDRIRKFRPFVRPTDAAYTMRVGKDVDFRNKAAMKDFLVDPGGAIWGNFNWGDGTLWGDNTQLVDDAVSMSGRGKLTQYRFENDALDAPVELYGYGALVKSGRPR